MATVIKPSQGSQTQVVVKVTQADSPYPLSRHFCPCQIVNEGASGLCEVLLPTDALGGEEVKATVMTAQDLRLDPGAGNRIFGSDATTFGDLADGKGVIGDAIGETIHLVCLGPDGSGDIEWLATVQHNNSPGTGGFFNEEEA